MEINILLGCNDSYIPFTSTTMVSIFENNRCHQCKIFLICPDITHEHRTLLEEMCRRYGQEIYWCSLTLEQFDVIEQCSKVIHGKNKAMLYRLLAPEILPREIDKILYLDCDTIVVGDLAACFETDISQCAAAVVRDNFRISDYHRLQIKYREHEYFNSGVMLINVSYWRANHVGQQCLSWRISHQSPFVDQDALNVVLFRCVKYLHPKYNSLISYWRPKDNLKKACFYDYIDDIQEAIDCPTIIHFAYFKPWQSITDLPFSDVWRYYSLLTPWEGGPIDDVQLRKAKKKKQKKLLFDLAKTRIKNFVKFIIIYFNPSADKWIADEEQVERTMHNLPIHKPQ